jgi:hypothetical protein
VRIHEKEQTARIRPEMMYRRIFMGASFAPGLCSRGTDDNGDPRQDATATV